MNWNLEESAEVARRRYQQQVGTKLGGWDAIKRAWLSAKQDIINALDPTTGRLEIPITIEDSGQLYESVLRWHRAMAQRHYPLITDDYWTWNPDTGRSERSANWVPAPANVEVQTNQVASGSYLNTAGGRTGQALTRAYRTILLARGLDAKAVELEVSALGETIARDRTQKGFLVLSANILDILMASENAYFTSCHAFGGAHAAGPLEYALDKNSIVSYFYREERDYLVGGSSFERLPYKLHRRMIFLDAKNGTAGLARQYGSELNKETESAQIHATAKVLATLRGDAEPSKDAYDVRNLYSSFWAKAWDFHSDRGGYSYAYLDGLDVLLRLHSAPLTVRHDGYSNQEYEVAYMRVSAEPMLCPVCGHRREYDDDPGALSCEDCGSGGHSRCHHCGDRLYEDDAAYINDEYYCGNCASDLFLRCDHCGDWTTEDDSVVLANGDTYCPSCADIRTAVCDHCNEAHDTYHETSYTVEGELWCETCVSDDATRCHDCGDLFRDNNVTEHNGNFYCPECYDEVTTREEEAV